MEKKDRKLVFGPRGRVVEVWMPVVATLWLGLNLLLILAVVADIYWI